MRGPKHNLLHQARQHHEPQTHLQLRDPTRLDILTHRHLHAPHHHPLRPRSHPRPTRLTGNERGLNLLQRIGTGLLFSILAMAVAALVEAKRLRVVAKTEVALDDKGHVKLGVTLPMSVFWLAPQFVILGIGDGFTLVGLQEYFYDQVPDNMRSLGIAFYSSVLGASSFLSSLLITVVDHVSRRGGRESWIGKDLNHSKLDKFYWLLGVMSGLNLFVYVLLARRYSYKRVQTTKVDVANNSLSHEAHELRGMGPINGDI
ncbi:hypothetical protein Syun_000442 [Stephania yunnanensis]|uniref:Uncharacterized protein n=1 Tax=Stephania yunnanensis TaxID=152371 RepID=A0AAP0LDP4_9MAGN